MRSIGPRLGRRGARVVADVVAACKLCQFDFIIVETPGIGQGDTFVVPLATPRCMS